MDSEEIVTNSKGGKQSKLYVAYNLIDPWTLEALASIHHRGSIKYAPDNWRNIPIEEHINHAMHHIMQAMKYHTRVRLHGLTPAFDAEDHLAHALCRITFAKAMEITQYGHHPEHSDPTYHESKAASVERETIRDDARRFPPVHPTYGFDEAPRSFTTLADKIRRDDPKRAPTPGSSEEARARRTTLSSGGGRRRPVTHRRK